MIRRRFLQWLLALPLTAMLTGAGSRSLGDLRLHRGWVLTRDDLDRLNGPR
ncbi:MAG: hypothetical protein H6980_03345 [Gammaproteobacteria bacterium]|nr:hypothetical protein [Gammaproteobacteria bacterium]